MHLKSNLLTLAAYGISVIEGQIVRLLHRLLPERPHLRSILSDCLLTGPAPSLVPFESTGSTSLSFSKTYLEPQALEQRTRNPARQSLFNTGGRSSSRSYLSAPLLDSLTESAEDSPQIPRELPASLPTSQSRTSCSRSEPGLAPFLPSLPNLPAQPPPPIYRSIGPVGLLPYLAAAEALEHESHLRNQDQ